MRCYHPRRALDAFWPVHFPVQADCPAWEPHRYWHQNQSGWLVPVRSGRFPSQYPSWIQVSGVEMEAKRSAVRPLAEKAHWAQKADSAPWEWKARPLVWALVQRSAWERKGKVYWVPLKQPAWKLQGASPPGQGA